MKKILRWALYVFLFLCAAGMIQESEKSAIGLLAGVAAWSAYKLHQVLAGIKDALDRIGRIAGPNGDAR